MPYSLRIARTSGGDDAPGAAGSLLHGMHGKIVQVLEGRGARQAATVLAQPRAISGGVVEWYAAAAGQPVALTALSAAERLRAEEALRSRLDAIRRIADRLAADGSAEAAVVSAMRAASAAPDAEAVLVINGQPVIVGWGRQAWVDRAGHPAPATTDPAPAAASAPAPVQGQAAGASARRGGGAFRTAAMAVAAVVAVAALGAALLWLRPAVLGDETALVGAAPEAEPPDLEALRRQVAQAEDRLRQKLSACPPRRD